MGKSFFENNADYFYFVFRILVAVLFIMHGWMKVPGIMSGETSIASLMGLAAIIEVIGGILLLIGLLTRWVALIAALEMLVAFFMAHAPQGWNPLANRGEPALLFFAAFLVLIAFGARKWAVDKN